MLGLVVGGFVVGRILTAILRRFARKSGSPAWTLATDAIGTPLVVAVVLLGLGLGIGSLELRARIADIFTSAIEFCLVLVLVSAVVRTYDAIHTGVLLPLGARPDSELDQHFFELVRAIARPLLWIAGIATALTGVGFDVSAVLAGMGIGGMAIALASQDTVANVFGGVLVLTERPFKTGDRIEVSGVEGWVQKINLRNTVVHDWYGRAVTIPNKRFTDEAVINVDAQPCYYEELCVRIDPGVTADEAETALVIIREVIEELDTTENSPWVTLKELALGHHEIEIWFGVALWKPAESARFNDYYAKISDAKNRVHLGILRRFAAAGIPLAVPVLLRSPRATAFRKRHLREVSR